jgi:anti-sigma factor RsiW
MNCRDYEAQIGDYVDGSLDEAAQASLEAHLSGCARCRAMAADFATIRRASVALESHVPPPQVWHRISSALERKPRPIFGAGGAWWQSFAAAAGAITIVVSLSWTAGRLSPIASERNQLASATTGSGAEPAVSIAVEYERAAQGLTSTIEGLERLAAVDGTELDMETRDVLQANLTVLDGAIGESREALLKEPENDVAQESLFEALRSKVALLQDTIALINEMRKGNQEGAARIVSGLNP